MKKENNTPAAQRARESAVDTLATYEKTTGLPLAILDEHTERVVDGFVFFYNSQSFIASGDFRDSLAGNGPIFVSDSGQVKVLGTAQDWRQELSLMRASESQPRRET